MYVVIDSTPPSLHVVSETFFSKAFFFFTIFTSENNLILVASPTLPLVNSQCGNLILREINFGHLKTLDFMYSCN